jgi:hypothetical protein
MLDRKKVSNFRNDFQTAIAQLEKDYGVQISLGTIRFDSQELRAKMIAKVGEATPRATKNDFKVGDVVGINHKKVMDDEEFEILKINNKNIKVQKITQDDMMVGAIITVSPNLLIKK